MVQGAVSFVDRNGPAHGYAVLDRAHLTRMTFNDPSLEEEVLQLFERQAELLMVRIRKSAPAAIATLAHTSKDPQSVSVLTASRRRPQPPN
jgi:hypothetical protein